MRTDQSTPIALRADADDGRAVCRELRAYLEQARRFADDEIRLYPKPIPRCDAQFNHLYEQRSRISAALERLNAALSDPALPLVAAQAIADLLASEPCTEQQEEKDLRAKLRDLLHG